MTGMLIFVVVVAVIVVIAVIEFATAVLPILIVVTFVPPEQRAELAQVIAAIDSSRKLRLWPALRAAVRARRRASTEDARPSPTGSVGPS